MRIVVSGGSGLVGSALIRKLEASGHRVVRAVRSPLSGSGSGETVAWDPKVGLDLGAASLDGVEGVVHLAGENIAGGRWSAARKARIRDSRVGPTETLARQFAHWPTPPRVLVAASAIGFYGDRGATELGEDAAAGEGYLPEVCAAWEAATAPAAEAGVRVVNLRIGVVLAREGGALAKMLTPFRLGVGGRIGDGRQFLSWISLPDLVDALHHALVTEELRGPVNGVAPEPVDNATFTRALGRVLGRPTIFPLPAPVARLVIGEMADALLLASTRVVPTKLGASGFSFAHPDVESALRAVLDRPA